MTETLIAMGAVFIGVYLALRLWERSMGVRVEEMQPDHYQIAEFDNVPACNAWLREQNDILVWDVKTVAGSDHLYLMVIYERLEVEEE